MLLMMSVLSLLMLFGCVDCGCVYNVVDAGCCAIRAYVRGAVDCVAGCVVAGVGGVDGVDVIAGVICGWLFVSLLALLPSLLPLSALRVLLT